MHLFLRLNTVIIAITAIIIRIFIYQMLEFYSNWIKVLLLKFLVVPPAASSAPCSCPHPHLLSVASCSTAPTTRHLEVAPSNDRPAHCSDWQPASQEHTNRKHAQSLISNSSERHVTTFFSLLPSQAPLNSLYAVFQRFLNLQFPLLRFCLMYVPSDKSLQSFHLCLIPSFLVVHHRKITETGAINRRLGRLLLLFKPTIKDIHHHQAYW